MTASESGRRRDGAWGRMASYAHVVYAGGTMPSHPIGKSYGTVAVERQRAMSGLAFVQGLADGSLPLNMIARPLGYDVAEAETGRVVVTAEPGEIHLNPAGTVHGGLAATMLD